VEVHRRRNRVFSTLAFIVAVLLLEALGLFWDFLFVKYTVQVYGALEEISRDPTIITAQKPLRSVAGRAGAKAPSSQACRHTPSGGWAAGGPRRDFVLQATSLSSGLWRFMAYIIILCPRQGFAQ
jgi:hypothetical protein